MKQISEEEFEQYVEAIINGDMSKAQVVKELQTEARTLNNRIHELILTNPELHRRYVEKHPYKPRDRKDLDAMQLAIEILTEGKTILQIAEEHQTGTRTIQRRINSLNNSKSLLEKRVYDLCKEMGKNNSKRDGKIPEELARKIQQLLDEIEAEKLIGCRGIETNVNEKRTQLLELERRYHELCLTMSRGEAAKVLGYTQGRINKLLNELYRIEIERTAKTQGRDFRQGLKAEVDGINGEKQEIELVEGETQKEEERE